MTGAERVTGTEPKVTQELALSHGLTAEEYDRIIRRLGREPRFTELGLFSALWSEHCAYKHSRVFLRDLPTQGPQVLQGPGENAGIVDLGGGLALTFKIESHNHPSFIEPFQGAATGVGGILRDIFTMGARPIAILDSLRFAPLDDPKARHLLEGVVSGISWYGNCFGVPNLGGEVGFAPEYAGNPLVNAMAVGLVRTDRIFRARAEGVGNPVFYVGAKTGRDGIHGATMASATFDEGAAERRPTVQVGDPFTEKLLLEACLEAMATGAIVGIQDMGAAGLACACSEMPARAGTGMEVDLDRVPQRERGMTPYEIMLSESQERMLLVCTRGREAEIRGVFAKWELDAVEIGRVTGDGILRARMHGEIVVEVPVEGAGRRGARLREAHRAPGLARRARGLRPAYPARGRAGGGAAGPRGLARHRVQALGVPAVRHAGRAQHGGHARLRRGDPAHQGHRQGGGGHHRWQCPPSLSRSPPGRRDGGGGGRPQPRRIRCAAPGPDRLPQLRLAGAARDPLAVQGSGGRYRRGLPGPRDPGGRRQCLLLQ